MKARLNVEVDPGPIERVRADLAVVLLYQGERPLRGPIGRADWRLCGHLSRLVAAGRLRGVRGEALLMPSRGGLRTPLLVAMGAGPRGALRAGDWEAVAAEAVERGLKLGAAVIALPLPVPDGEDTESALRQRVEALVSGAARALAGFAPELRLRLVAGRGEAGRAAEALRGARPGLAAASVEIRLSSAPAPRRQTARVGQGPERTAPQLLK